MPFSSTPDPIGNYQLIARTKKRDMLAGIGAQAVFGGPGNDTLTGNSQATPDGLYQIPPILSGGAGNDTYIIKDGTFSIIADLGGGNDTIKTNLNINNVSFASINGRDIYATDGSTSVIIVDPLGTENANNKIESVFFGKKRYSTEQLSRMALNSNNYLGEFTYAQLESAGYINFEILGLDPLGVDNYISSARFNNSIVS